MIAQIITVEPAVIIVMQIIVANYHCLWWALDRRCNRIKHVSQSYLTFIKILCSMIILNLLSFLVSLRINGYSLIVSSYDKKMNFIIVNRHNFYSSYRLSSFTY